MAALSCPGGGAPCAPSFPSFPFSLYRGLIIRKRFAWGMWFTGTVTHVVERRVQDEPCEPCGVPVLGEPSTTNVGGNKLLDDNAQCWPHVDL